MQTLCIYNELLLRMYRDVVKLKILKINKIINRSFGFSTVMKQSFIMIRN